LNKQSLIQLLAKPLSFFKRMNIHSVLALAGISGPVILIVTDLTASMLNPAYSPVRDSISSLALTRIGWLQTIGFLAIGLLVEIFVAGLLFNIRGVRGFRLSIGMLVCFGFLLLLIGAFHTNPVDGPDTIDGTIHTIVATGAFWLFPFAVFIIAPSIRSDPRWKSLFRYTIAAGILGFAFIIVLGILQDGTSCFGLLERLLVANMIIWVGVAAVWMLRISVNR
jgi:hypothetical protein